MGGISGTSAVIKLVAFILACVCLALSILIYRIGSWHFCLLAGAVFGGFFWYYLVAFIGMVTGDQLDTDVAKNYAIYACVCYFGAGLRTLLAYAGNNRDDDATISLLCGVVAIATSVLAFLDAFFSK